MTKLLPVPTSRPLESYQLIVPEPLALSVNEPASQIVSPTTIGFNGPTTITSIGEEALSHVPFGVKISQS